MLQKNTLTYYQILKIDELASNEEIKKAYRQLMLQYHPDVAKTPLASEQFEKVVQAYKVLSNSEERSKYDKNKHAKFVKNTISTLKPRNINYKNFRTSISKKLKLKNLINILKINKSLKEDKNFFVVPEEILNLHPKDLKLRFLESSNKYVRAEALKSLVINCGTRCYKLIEAGFHDQSKEVKEVAVHAIGKLKIRQGVLHLANLYKTSGPHMRKTIIKCLALINTKKSNDLVAHSCFDRNESVQLEALKIIKNTKLYEYLPKIKSLIHHQNKDIHLLIKSMLK